MTPAVPSTPLALPPPSLDLSVIIVSYNTAELTEQTIRSVINELRENKALRDATEIIVVDNQSTDDSTQRIRSVRSEFSTVALHLITSERNLGFGNANNLGLTKAKGRNYLFLNSDTQLQPHALAHLLATLTDFPAAATATLTTAINKLDRLGILAADLVNPDGSAQPQGGNLPSLFSVAAHMLMLDDIPLLGKLLPSTQHTGQRGKDLITKQGLRQQGWVGGTAMLVKREVIEEIGAWDPAIFMYGEDIDLCWRARNHHWDVAIDPGARVVHYGSASSSSETALRGEFLAYLYLWAKHQPAWQLQFVRAILRLGAQQRQVLFALLGKAQKAAIYARISHEVLR